MVSNNIFNNNTKLEAYPGISPSEIVIGGYTRNVVIQNNIIQNGTFGIKTTYGNITIKNNKIENIQNDGIKIQGNNQLHVKIDFNDIRDCLSNAIEINADSGYIRNGQIIGNYIYGGGSWSISIALTDARNFTVYGNTIVASAANVPSDCIYEAGTSDFNTIILNKFIRFPGTAFQSTVTKIGTNTKINCTGLTSWNFGT